MREYIPCYHRQGNFCKGAKRLQQNKILAGANSAIEPYLLTGKAFCGHCGTAMIAGGGTSHIGAKNIIIMFVSRKKSTLRQETTRTKTNWNCTLPNAVYTIFERYEKSSKVAARHDKLPRATHGRQRNAEHRSANPPRTRRGGTTHKRLSFWRATTYCGQI